MNLRNSGERPSTRRPTGPSAATPWSAASGPAQAGACGALGFEAASRGAAEVLLLEQDAPLVVSLNASRQRLKADTLRIERSDALVWMARSAPAGFELVLIDPPFDARLSGRAAGLAAPLLVPGGYLYVEASEPLDEPPPGLSLHRTSRAGAVHFQLFRRDYTPAVEPTRNVP